MTIPLPNPLSTTEAVLIGLLLVFFAVWGWRHGLDATLIAGLFTVVALVAVPKLAPELAKVLNLIVGGMQLFTGGQFSKENLDAIANAQYQPIPSLINVQDANSTGMVLVTLGLFGVIVYIGFNYAVKKAGRKDPFFESVFGFIGAGVLGYVILTFVLEHLVQFPPVVIEQGAVPDIKVNAVLLVAVLVVLIVFGVKRSKPPAKKK